MGRTVFVEMNLPRIERREVSPLPTGAMRVAPRSDALVWRTTPAKDEPRIVDGDSPDWHAKGL
jgi:hypothetical protein